MDIARAPISCMIDFQNVLNGIHFQAPFSQDEVQFTQNIISYEL